MEKVYILIIVLAAALFTDICRAEYKESQDKDVSLTQVAPKKVEMDTNYDGKADRIEIYDDAGQIVRLESDTNSDSIIDEWVIFEKGNPVKKEKDTNADGKADVWVAY